MPRTKAFLGVLTLFITISALWFRFGKTFPEWLSIAACAWMFLIGPVALFITARLAREEIHFENPRGIIGMVLRVLVVSPLGCFGIVCMVTGLAVIALAVWSAVVKADFAMLKNVPGLLVFAGMTAFGVFVLRQALMGEGQTRREIEKAEQVRQEALLHPDWAFYAEHLRRPVPDALQKLYLDEQRVQAIADFPEKDAVAELQCFEPLQRDYLVPAGESDLPYDIVPFATADDESWVFLKPGENETNRVLMVAPEEPEQIVILADSVEAFLAALSWERTAAFDS